MITRRNFLKKVGAALACVPFVGLVKPDKVASDEYVWRSKTYYPPVKPSYGWEYHSAPCGKMSKGKAILLKEKVRALELEFTRKLAESIYG